MKRTDSAGSTVDNLYTNGNPSLSIPATVVDASALNAMQEEIANVIEDTGATLDQTNADLTQLLTAVKSLIGIGGVQGSFAVVNNTAAPANVTGLLFDANDYKAVLIDYDIHRQSDTASSEVDETGQLRLTYDSVGGVWRASQVSSFDDSGVVFSITGAGQVQYTSTDIAGTNSVGTLRYTVKYINQ